MTGNEETPSPTTSVFFKTRGLLVIGAVALALVLKVATDSSVPAPGAWALFALALTAASFRVWASGYIGRQVRGTKIGAERLITAGPYAFLRNPLYLGTLVMSLSLGGMSGLWYGPLLPLAAWMLVYINVIPLEERYLSERFGEEFECYRRAVPRLYPTLRPYRERYGSFYIGKALIAEWFTFSTTALFGVLFLAL